MVDIPLSQRVTAPPVEVPADTAVIAWRPTTATDVDGLVALTEAMSAVDHPHYSESPEEIEDELGRSFIDLERDSLVAVERSTGRLIATGLVILPPGRETVVRSILLGGIHPAWRGRGLGRQLLAWQKARGLGQLAGSDKTIPGWLMVYTEALEPSQGRLAERFGFTETRWFVGQERRVADEIPDVALPPGIRIEPFAPKWSERAHVAKDDSFRDHWGSQPSSSEQWESFVALPSFSAPTSVVAVTDADEVVGVLLSEVAPDDWERAGYSSGYISTLGVIREWRRRGIAPALLAHVLRAYRAAGYERAALDVDSDSPTGAPALYSGMGFTETTRQVVYTTVY